MTTDELKVGAHYLLRSKDAGEVHGTLSLLSVNKKSLAFELAEPLPIRPKQGGLIIAPFLLLLDVGVLEDFWGNGWEIVKEEQP